MDTACQVLHPSAGQRSRASRVPSRVPAVPTHDSHHRLVIVYLWTVNMQLRPYPSTQQLPRGVANFRSPLGALHTQSAHEHYRNHPVLHAVPSCLCTSAVLHHCNLRFSFGVAVVGKYDSLNIFRVLPTGVPTSWPVFRFVPRYRVMFSLLRPHPRHPAAAADLVDWEWIARPPSYCLR